MNTPMVIVPVQWQAVAVDDAMVERACVAMAESDGVEWPTGYHDEPCRRGMRAALAAALAQQADKDAP